MSAPRDPGPCRWTLPDPATADDGDLVGVGADLEPATLVAAYRAGIFPWPHENWPLPWFSPDPRAVFTPDSLRPAKRFLRALRGTGWTTTCDAAFTDVVAGCAGARTEGTWITPAMREAYGRLNDLGWAHSVEVWEGENLVGGIYGVQVGGVFTGESMFHRLPGASKAALYDLVLRLSDAGGWGLDAQLPTPHLTSLGARELPRAAFLDVLAAWRDRTVTLPCDRRPALDLARRLAPSSLRVPT